MSFDPTQDNSKAFQLLKLGANWLHAGNLNQQLLDDWKKITRLTHQVMIANPDRDAAAQWCTQHVGPVLTTWLCVDGHHWLFLQDHDAMQFSLVWV